MAKKKVARTKRQSSEEPGFEASLAEVEKIVANLESGELGLAASLEQYEQGIKQLKRCQTLLDQADQKVTMLSGFDADGNPITEPVEGQRRSSSSGGPGKRIKKRSASETFDQSTIDEDTGLF